ncbi:glucarate dehydratase [Brevibacterium sanguinis]|uniref:glucarate dehydratase n=2 Tax=Brevibacterium TaxID=1696 RepID=A0A366IHB1_9MICO|nr:MULTISPECIES: glucarate dehydratase family protein [Brevibacterium]RBP64979.1 glucarate dehydratase [Brevibacterium sanguinis]RBP71242.1 glucarate dehydratase [Brevibacterium celere]
MNEQLSAASAGTRTPAATALEGTSGLPVTSARARIAEVRITPVAFADPPLLNAVGVHEPYALRTVIEIITDSGVYGLGESYGDEAHIRRLELASSALIGTDPFLLTASRSAVAEALTQDSGVGGHGMSGMITDSSTLDRVFSPFEVACLDVQGKLLGLPVSELLGGRVRDSVEFSGYLFYKWAAHPGHVEDSWGEALDPAGIVAQAQKMVSDYGFTALKLKGGVFPPEEEAAAIEALAEHFPGVPLRIDPNAAWTVETSIQVADRLESVLEYLEDPTPGIAGMAEVRKAVAMPVATNMCVVAFDQLPSAIAAGSVDIILSDHHFWGGLRRSGLLAGTAETFGMSLSMHSNSHLGISLAAMLHLAAATPNIDYACDTHWPWKNPEDDVIMGSPFRFVDGRVAVPTSPGLGVELDRDKLARLHEAYLDCGIRNRDDTGYMQRFDPEYSALAPRW